MNKWMIFIICGRFRTTCSKAIYHAIGKVGYCHFNLRDGVLLVALPKVSSSVLVRKHTLDLWCRITAQLILGQIMFYWTIDINGSIHDLLLTGTKHISMGLVQERRNYSTLAMGLRFSCPNPSICSWTIVNVSSRMFLVCRQGKMSPIYPQMSAIYMSYDCAWQCVNSVTGCFCVY